MKCWIASAFWGSDRRGASVARLLAARGVGEKTGVSYSWNSGPQWVHPLAGRSRPTTRKAMATGWSWTHVFRKLI